MKDLQKALLSLAILQFAIGLIESACPTASQCLHSGVVNTAACKCDCYPVYSGTYCEKATNKCANQPAECGTALTSDFCIFPSIATYCPKMCNAPLCSNSCGLDSCLNSGVFNPVSCTCQCPANYFGEICQTYTTCSVILSCVNGAFNPSTCACDCNSGFTGVRCEQILTTKVAVTTIIATTATVTTTTGPVVTSCQPLACQNGFNFDLAACACKCGTGFTGTLCETFNCATSPVPDIASLCPILTCGDPATTATCPFKCLCTATTTTITTTTTVAPVVTSCQPLACQNGFNFDLAACACRCGTGFTGNLCETYNCATKPVPDNASLCPLLTCGDPVTTATCPAKCLCGGSTPAP